MKQSFKRVALATMMTAALAACGGKTNIESDLGIKGAPDWVNEGTSAVSDQKGRLIQGVGMSQPIGDVSLQRNTADNRARAEIARILSTFVDSTMKDYTESVNGQVDASVSREINSVTQLALNGSRILGRWKDKNTGDIYAFAEMDMKQLDELMKTSQSLSESFRDFYQSQGDTHFDALTTQESE